MPYDCHGKCLISWNYKLLRSALCHITHDFKEFGVYNVSLNAYGTCEVVSDKDGVDIYMREYLGRWGINVKNIYMYKKKSSSKVITLCFQRFSPFSSSFLLAVFSQKYFHAPLKGIGMGQTRTRQLRELNRIQKIPRKGWGAWILSEGESLISNCLFIKYSDDY